MPPLFKIHIPEVSLLKFVDISLTSYTHLPLKYFVSFVFIWNFNLLKKILSWLLAFTNPIL